MRETSHRERREAPDGHWMVTGWSPDVHQMEELAPLLSSRALSLLRIGLGYARGGGAPPL